MNKIYISLLTVAFSFFVSVESQTQQLLTLYEDVDCNGASETIDGKSDNLANYGFDNQARSARITGAWLFYDKRSYNTQVPAAMEYAFEPVNTCVNFQNLGGNISSVQFAGELNDYRRDRIFLYENTFFQGRNEYLIGNQDVNMMRGRVRSLIVTGISSLGWTLYDQRNFTGNSVCVFPPPSESNYEPAFITDTHDIGIPHNMTMSVRKGCHAAHTRVVNVNSIPLGMHKI